MGVIKASVPPVPYLGYIMTPNSAGTVVSNNNAHTVPVWTPRACTVTGVRLVIGTSSGNIDVGIYDSVGNRLASSGSVASPGTGLRTVSFSASVSIPAGTYYLAVAADNTTVTFGRMGVDAVLGTYVFATSFPLPTTLTLPGTVSTRVFTLAGIVSGGISA